MFRGGKRPSSLHWVVRPLQCVDICVFFLNACGEKNLKYFSLWMWPFSPHFTGKIERKHHIFSRNIFSLLVAPARTAREEFCDSRHTLETFPVNCVYSQYEKGVGISKVKQSIFVRRTTHVW